MDRISNNLDLERFRALQVIAAYHFGAGWPLSFMHGLASRLKDIDAVIWEESKVARMGHIKGTRREHSHCWWRSRI